MLGAIIGDTVGSHYEFHNTKDYDFELYANPSSYTDDTVMTMAVASWLLHDKQNSYQGLEDAMVLFAGKYRCPMGGYGGFFHRWLFAPESRWPDCGTPYQSATGRRPYGSWGNGSAMRASAVGWFFDTLEETERVAEISAAITHNAPEGIKGAQATAAAIFMARNGAEKEEIRDYFSSKYGYDLSKTWEYWHPIYQWDSSCQGTVPQAIIAFRRQSLPSWTLNPLKMPSGRPCPSAGTPIRWPALRAVLRRPTTASCRQRSPTRRWSGCRMSSRTCCMPFPRRRPTRAGLLW